MLGLATAAAVRAREYLDQVAIGIVEIEPQPVVPPVDGARLLVKRVRPVGNPARLYAAMNGIELRLGNPEGKVTRCDRAVSRKIVQRCRPHFEDGEMAKTFGGRDTQQF